MGIGHSHSVKISAENSENLAQTRIAIAFIITCAYMVVEIVGGFLFNSLALLADAGHMFSDAMALGLSWVAIRIGRRHASNRLTYGFSRSEILAALLNCIALWAIVAMIFFEAAQRIFNPAPVLGSGVFFVATIGLALNLTMAGLLFSKRKENLNVKAAFLHVLSDTLGSIGALVAGLIIMWTHAFWIDPVISLLIGLLILISSWGLLQETVNILMEGVPKGMDVSAIESAIVNIEGVCCVYDLHLWNISSKQVNLSAHVVLSETTADPDRILQEILQMVKQEFGVSHSTIQIETSHNNNWLADPRICRPGTSCHGHNEPQ
ncbi:MAG: cation diffusion facilitator family transporter [Pseudomonadota bacterium]